MTVSRLLKWVTGACELFLGIPIIGAAVIIGNGYAPLFIMLILHIVTLVLSNRNREPKYGSVFGIVTSLLAWIPFVGMILHIITGIALWVSAVRRSAG